MLHNKCSQHVFKNDESLAFVTLSSRFSKPNPTPNTPTLSPQTSIPPNPHLHRHATQARVPPTPRPLVPLDILFHPPSCPSHQTPCCLEAEHRLTAARAHSVTRAHFITRAYSSICRPPFALQKRLQPLHLCLQNLPLLPVPAAHRNLVTRALPPLAHEAPEVHRHS